VYIYRILGDRVGTVEAQELAAQLIAWHDAMVKHARVAGRQRRDTCEDGCPHDDAVRLWTEALSVFGNEANQLAFLRNHGCGLRRTMRAARAGLRA
jgi:hypothetical protein